MATTVISVLYRDCGIFDYMIKTVFASSDNVEKILVCDNANNKRMAEKYKKDPRVQFIKGVNDSTNTSMNHGRGVNKLLPLVNTSTVALIEPDVIVLSRGWDDLPEHIDLRACSKNIYSGLSCYYPCFIVGKTEKLQKIDFEPTGKGILINEHKSYKDTGWRMSIADLVVEPLEYKNCVAGECSIVPNKIFEKKTNEFWLNGKPVAAHLWRGSTPQRRGQSYVTHIKVWKETAEKILKSLGQQK